MISTGGAKISQIQTQYRNTIYGKCDWTKSESFSVCVCVCVSGLSVDTPHVSPTMGTLDRKDKFKL